MKKFAVFDIDGTLIRWQLYHAISDAFVRLGFVKPEAYQAVKDARMKWKQRAGDFKSYEQVLINTYEAELEKLSRSRFLIAVEAVFDEYKDQTYIYPRKLIDHLKKADYLLFAISGSQVEIVEKVAKFWGFDRSVGTTYEVLGDKYTGKKVVGSADKARTLQRLVKRSGAQFKDSVAIGDSASDIPMLELVDQPIAFNPEAELFKVAVKNGWRVVVERKNVVYEMAGKDAKYQLVKTSSG